MLSSLVRRRAAPCATGEVARLVASGCSSSRGGICAASSAGGRALFLSTPVLLAARWPSPPPPPLPPRRATPPTVGKAAQSPVTSSPPGAAPGPTPRPAPGTDVPKMFETDMAPYYTAGGRTERFANDRVIDLEAQAAEEAEARERAGGPKKRMYLSGFENHPYYGEDAQRRALERRGFRREIDKGHLEREARARPDNQRAPGGAQRQDGRFARPIEDYREIQDNDPYAGVFGERKSVGKLRLKEWRKQFEAENEDVELPYERTSRIFRATPNWFVRIFVRARSRGFLEPFYLHMSFSIVLVLGALANAAAGPRPHEAKDNSLMG